MRLPATSPALAPISLLLLLLAAVSPAASQTPVFFTYPNNVSAPLGTTVVMECEADQPALAWRINDIQLLDQFFIDTAVNQGFVEEVGGIERTARGYRSNITIPATEAVNDSVDAIVCQAGPTEFSLHDGEDISFSVFGHPLAPGEVEVREDTALQLQLSWSPPFSLPRENISYSLLVQNVTSGLNQTMSPLSLTAFTHHLPQDQALHCHHFIFSIFSLNQVGLSLNSSSTDPLLHPSGPGPLGEIETEVSHDNTQTAGSRAVLHLTFQSPASCFPLNYTISLREEESGNQSTFPTTSSGSGMETIEVPGLQENTRYSATLSASNHFSFSANDPVQASLTPFVTSGLQSVSVLQYQNGSVRISCGFASGSMAAGCEVSLSFDTSITVEIEVSRSEGALEAVRVSSIAGVPSSVEGRELGTSASLVISGKLSSEGDIVTDPPVATSSTSPSATPTTGPTSDPTSSTSDLSDLLTWAIPAGVGLAVLALIVLFTFFCVCCRHSSSKNYHMRRRSTLPSGLHVPHSPASPSYSHDYKQVPPHVTGNIKQMSFNPLYGEAPATTFDPPLPSLPRVANGGESITLPSDLPPPLYEEVSASRKAAKLAANPQYGAVGGANGATPNPQYGPPPRKLVAPPTEEHMYASLKDPSHLQTSRLEQQTALQYAQPYEHVQSSHAPPTLAPPTTEGVAILTEDNVSYSAASSVGSPHHESL